MSRTIVVLTEPDDIHAYAVAEALSIKGGRAILWHTPDFPSRCTETFHFRGGQLETAIEGSDFRILDEDRPRAVWRRRPAHALLGASLHPADLSFAETQCSVFRRAALSVFAEDSFWVNPPDAANRASRKILQHKLALTVGFSVPDTLYTNDPQKIRDFIRDHGGIAVYKPFRGVVWRDANYSWAPFTSAVTEATLVDSELLQLVPGIYQELIPKAYEIRITAMGRQLFAAKILSQETESGKLDWRKSYSDLRMEPLELTPELSSLCLSLMSRLDIVFGCFDIVVTPQGDHFFLEVNEMGQFLFVERLTDLPLLDAFSEFLLSADPCFIWTPSVPRIRYADLEGRIHRMAEESAQSHVSLPEVVSWEGF
jgi:glutathione synthase/RimK-type ligase-like ATP-grasp enzyme